MPGLFTDFFTHLSSVVDLRIFHYTHGFLHEESAHTLILDIDLALGSTRRGARTHCCIHVHRGILLFGMTVAEKADNPFP